MSVYGFEEDIYERNPKGFMGTFHKEHRKGKEKSLQKEIESIGKNLPKVKNRICPPFFS
ncbi:MAG: hypothetical protein ABFS18_00200 [Thermodesulfobacteriota bacterium]